MKTTQMLEDLLMEYEPTPQEYAAVYARKSTKVDNNSIQSQTSLAMDVIKKEGLLLYKVYSDIETATKYEPIHRVGFKELMHDTMEGKGKFKTLIVFRRDRLARKAEHLVEIKKFFKKYNVRIIYSNDGEFQPDDSYISNFIENIIMAVDELEPRILSERIESGKNKKRERGEYSCGCNLPFGYCRKTIHGSIRYVFVPEEIELVKKVFNEYVNNSSISRNMKKLRKEILEYKILKDKKLYEKTHNKKYLKTVPLSIMTTIKTPIYANLQFKNNKLKITYEDKDIFNIVNATNPIINRHLFQECCNVDRAIDKDMWYKAAEKWKASNLKRDGVGNKAETQLFKNLIFCTHCNDKVWFTKENFKCKKGCFNMPKVVAINEVLFSVLVNLVEDEHFTSNLQRKIDILRTKITDLENIISTNATLIKNRVVEMVISGKSSDVALTKFFNKEHEENAKLSVLKMESMDLFYLRDNIKSLVSSPKIITDLKERQDYLQKLLQNIIEKVHISGSKEQIQTSITYRK